MTTCHICGAELVERKCLSCGHEECAECPIYGPTPTKDELITRIASQAQQIAQLREALERMSQPITDGEWEAYCWEKQRKRTLGRNDFDLLLKGRRDA